MDLWTILSAGFKYWRSRQCILYSSPLSACAAAAVVVLRGADSPGGANAATQEEEEVVTLQEPIPPLTWFKYYFAYADPLDMLMMLVGTAGAIVTVRRKEA